MGLKTAGVGHFTIPTAPAAGVSVTSGGANTFTTTPVQLIASTAAALYITGVHLESSAALAATYVTVQLMIGAGGSETIIGQYLVPLSTASTVALGYRQIYPPIPVASGIRISAKTADSVGAKATLVTLEVIAQSNVVDSGIAVGTVTNLTNAPTAGDFTATMKASITTAATAATPTATLANGAHGGAAASITLGGAAGLTATHIGNQTGNVSGSVGSVTGAVGSVTAGVTLAASQHVIVDSGTVTTLTNLPAITAGWLTATGIAAGALNGKGDWLLSSGYTAPPSAATNASAVRTELAAELARVDVATSTRLAAGSYTAPDNATITAIAGFVDTEVGAIKGVIDKLDTAMELDGAVYRFTLNALEMAPTGGAGGGLDAAGVRAAIGLASANLDTQLSGISTKTANLPAAPASTGDVTTVGTAVAAVAGDVAAVKGKTDSLAFTVAGQVDVNLRSVKGTAIAGTGTEADPWGP